ncbi:DUF3159 domain-containing protein [Cellulomonas shaoxiangyii]|uniref:DUF3159 domain-containing protein n=2 Tax=Cellulomonas shaoxiangyii TaxID=2566013 RepID=A0A4V1CN60_9CELL|nr:DUF3159 domain-containing protein [Cellulomonas shaoxiangyii]QCB95315.1 DUF3159 domain-containing protein [Cellulomonas shaoxiangyii]TGY84937.1 DUF3159 domain-containing protein [Cellulomonas shaoxiangyii]
MRAITAEQFSALDALGGVRGMVETIAPGLLFVVVYLVTGQQLTPALVAAGGAAVLAVLARLVQRTPVTQAFSGVLGVGVGVVWAWRTGDATDYFAYGLWVNGAYLVGTLVTVLVGWPLVGLVVGMFRNDGPLTGGPWSVVVDWRRDPVRRRRYALATWPWVGMFGLRLAVQLPLFLAGEVAWLGTAKLAMGLPLTALTLWLSWMLVRGSAGAPAPPRPRPHP